MKLSEFEVEKFKIKEPALSIYSDEEISCVVYDGVFDDKKNNDWVIVFGNSNQIQERIKTVYESYCNGRFR